MPARAVLDPLDRARCRADDRDRRADLGDEGVKPRRAARGKTGGRILRRAAEHDVRDSYVRWVRRLHTTLELLAHERLVVVRERTSDSVVRRHARLNENLAALGSAAGAAGHLTEQLKAALRGAEVRQVDPDIG